MGFLVSYFVQEQTITSFVILKASCGSTPYNTADCVTACQCTWVDGAHHLLLSLSPSSVQLEHVLQLLMRNLSEPWQEWWRRCPVYEQMTFCWNQLTPF